MWRRVVLAFSFMCVFYDHILSHPLTYSIDNGRLSRQLDLGECCPCPTKDEGQLRDHDTWPAPAVLRPSQRSPGLVDDCPCRGRDDDSDGSSSVFFPSATRAFNPLSVDPKEDPKNLLEPEVGLASSVLETLREATEEEYQDAVARDAARARAVEDATPEESGRNVVTIIVSPTQSDNNDVLSDASHLQESRCIHPNESSLGKMRSSASRSPSILTDIFKLPKVKSTSFLHRKQLDMDSSLGASNVHENAIPDNRDIVRSNSNGNSLRDAYNDECELKSASILSKLKPLKNNNIFDSIRFDRPSVPRIRLNDQFRNGNSDNVRSNDLSSASSIIDEQILEKQSPRFNLRTLLPVGNNMETNRPVSLKNLLKLRDVELIAPTGLNDREMPNIPKLILPSLFDRTNKLTELSDLFGKGKSLRFNNNHKTSKDYDRTEEAFIPETKVRNTQQSRTEKTEILDTIPSASNINKLSGNSCDTQDRHGLPPSTTIKENLESNHPTSPNDEFMETEILDAVPNPSENHPSVVHSNVDENIVINSLENQGEESNTCNISPNIEKKNSSEDEEGKEDETINARSDESNAVPDDDDQTIVKSDDYEIDTSNDIESPKTSCLENTEQNQDNIAFANNNIDMQSDLKNLNTESTAERASFPSEILTKQPENHEADSLQENEPNNRSNKLSTKKSNLLALTKNVVKKIEDFKRSSKLFKQKTPELVKEKTSKELDSRLLLNSKQSDEECDTESVMTTIPENLNRDVSNSNKNLSRTVSINDLQNLSDSLLKISNDNEKLGPTFKNVECNEEGSASTNGFNTFVMPKSLGDQTEAEQAFDKSSEITVNNKQGSIPTNSSEKSAEDITLSDVGTSKRSEMEENALNPLGRREEMNEMTAEASNPFTSEVYPDPLNLLGKTNLRLPLLQDIIVQPSSLFGDDVNIFENPIFDIGNPLNLPSLDDIRERLANMFGIDTGTAGDELSECAVESSLMSAEASNSNFQAKSPLKHLEDINLDIFQVKPLTMKKSNSMYDVPRLNLKTYKAKLPIPKNLDLKPMKLQSTLGNKGGLLGTILTVGPETRASKKISHIAQNPIGNIHNLEDVRAALKANAENVLGSRLGLNSNLFDNHLHPTISSFSDNLRSHAENTLRDIQHRMESTLQGVKVNDLLGGQLHKPQDLLEKIVDAREDFNDKLKGLHYDLNDRLTSLHDNILDQTRLMTQNKPVWREKSAKGNTPLKSNSRVIQTQRPAPTLQRFTTENRKESPKMKANSQRGPILGHVQTNNLRDQSTLKAIKMPTAASVPIPKHVAAPKLKSVSTKSSISNLEKDPKIKEILNKLNSRRAENTRGPTLQRQTNPFEENRLVLNKQRNPFKDSMSQVTFASTTTPPIPTLKSSQRTTPRPLERARIKDSELFRTSLPKYQLTFSGDPKGSASNMKTSRLDAPTAISVESKPLDSEEVVSGKGNLLSPNTRTKNIFRQNPAINGRTIPTVEVSDKSISKPKPREPNSLRKISTDKGSAISNPFPSIVWPKITENSFLSKVREAVQARLSNIDAVRARNGKTRVDNKNSKILASKPDMERSATDNSEIVLREPLKENTSYKCRMVCTRA